MLLFPSRRRCSRGRGRGGRGAAASAKSADQSGAVNTDIGEFVQIRNRNVQCLAATHGKARDGAVRPVGQHAVVLFHVGHNVLREVVGELVAAAGAPSPASAHSGNRVARRHHHDHGFGLFGFDQVVQNETGAAH